MPWVYFKAAFNYRVRPRAVTHCKAGGPWLVKQELAEAAIACGVGEIVERPTLPKVLKPVFTSKHTNRSRPGKRK